MFGPQLSAGPTLNLRIDMKRDFVFLANLVARGEWSVARRLLSIISASSVVSCWNVNWSFLFVVVLCASLTLVSSAAEPSGPTPKIDFDSVVFDFGRAKSGETLKHSFIFTNSGSATLEINDVKPGCGCTTAGTWHKTVAPGKTGMIPLQFNSTGFGGMVSKSVTVTCNDPARTNLFLQITGTVWKPIDITPAMAMFTPTTEAPTNETKVLKIVNNLDEMITLSDLKCSNPSFQAGLKEIKPGKEFELAVTAMPPFTNPTVFATITFKSSSTNAPMLNVSAYANVQQTVMVAPQQITLPAGPLKTPVNYVVLVRVNSTNAVEVSDLALDCAGADVKLVPSQPGRLYRINLTFPVGFEVSPGQKTELTFKSSHPSYPVLKVPVVQMQPMKAATAAATGASPSAGPGPGLLQPASPVPSRPLMASPAPVSK